MSNNSRLSPVIRTQPYSLPTFGAIVPNVRLCTMRTSLRRLVSLCLFRAIRALFQEGKRTYSFRAQSATQRASRAIAGSLPKHKHLARK